jgi:hypothetical protein
LDIKSGAWYSAGRRVPIDEQNVEISMSDQNDNKKLGWSQAKKHLDLEKPGVTDQQLALNVNEFAAYLIRTNYVIEVGKLITPAWAAMSEAQLTKYLAGKFTEEQLEKMFVKQSNLRQLIKNRARNFTLVSAVIVALIWCKTDLDSGNYFGAGVKFSTTVGGALALNYYFYGRDKSAATIMAKKMGNYGRWFQGVARTNRFANFLARRLMPALLAWDLRGLLMSSGSIDGPNIPFDFIIEIDIFDKSTWKAPPSTGLDFGLDFFYFQKSTKQWPVGYQQVCLGVIRGSLFRAPKRWMGLANNYGSKGVLSTGEQPGFSPADGGAKAARGPIGMA